MNERYISRENRLPTPENCHFLFIHFSVVVDAIVHARIISMYAILPKQNENINTRLLTDAIQMCIYLGGSIAVFPCREISLTTSAASIKNQFIQLRRKGNQLLDHLAS